MFRVGCRMILFVPLLGRSSVWKVRALGVQCLQCGVNRDLLLFVDRINPKCQCTTLLLPKREIHSTTGEL